MLFHETENEATDETIHEYETESDVSPDETSVDVNALDRLLVYFEEGTGIEDIVKVVDGHNGIIGGLKEDGSPFIVNGTPVIIVYLQKDIKTEDAIDELGYFPTEVMVLFQEGTHIVLIPKSFTLTTG